MELYLHRIHINGVVLNYVEWHIYLLNPVYCINLSQKRVQCLLLKHNNESPTLILSTFCFTFLLTSSKPTFNAHILHNTLRYKLDFHESVHRDTITKVTNKMQIYRLIYYFKSALHVSGDVFAYHQEHLTVFTVSGSIHTGCCRLVSWMSWNFVSTHPRQRPAGNWVNTTRYCKYSQVLLMMGENIARNVQSWLRIINWPV